MSEAYHIVIFVYQYSVVVKGIERNLNNLGHSVEIISDPVNLVGKTANTDLFLLYLPNDMSGDFSTQKSMEQICEMVKKGGRNLILFGEKKYHEELSDNVPIINDFDWYDRPVPADMLGPAIQKAVLETGSEKVKKRVLIVDDDASYAGMVREWIKGTYRADVVINGMNAITFLVKNTVDLILLDYEMPVVDGPQVLQMLRQEPATAHIPVVFLTGNGTKEAVERVMSLKPDGYVLKSTTKENLLGYLKKKLG
ncbi:MAG: response regulator [Lachnospiraceae bacterium]|nr:response regulator [Lachnospiraceae bacterium]